MLNALHRVNNTFNVLAYEVWRLIQSRACFELEYATAVMYIGGH